MKYGKAEFALTMGIIFPTTLAVIAGILAVKSMEGWGWFLFVALISYGAVSYSSK